MRSVPRRIDRTRMKKGRRRWRALQEAVLAQLRQRAPSRQAREGEKCETRDQEGESSLAMYEAQLMDFAMAA